MKANSDEAQELKKMYRHSYSLQLTGKAYWTLRRAAFKFYPGGIPGYPDSTEH